MHRPEHTPDQFARFGALARRWATSGATLLWEGRRASDRDERFRLYRRPGR